MQMNLRFISGIGGVILACALLAGAQEDTRTNPGTAAPPPPGGTVTQDTGTSGDNMNPDTHSLTGIQPLGVGSDRTARSYIAPTIQVTEYGDTNPGIAGRGTSIDSVTNPSGSIDMRRLWSHAQFTAHYTAGGFIYATDSQFNSMYHQFSLSQSFTGRRWSVIFADSGNYLPQTSFGFIGGGIGGIGLNQQFLVNQTILTGNTTEISNNVLGEVDYLMSPRSSISMSGSFDILHFTNFGTDSHDERGQIGFNHELGRHDTLGLSYAANLTQYSGTVIPSFITHSINVNYGHRITGRLALQLSGGPQLINGNDFVPGTGIGVSWNAQAGVVYHTARSSFGVTYWRYSNAGEGVFNGASTQAVSGTVTHRLARTLTGSVTGGYARNTNLVSLVGLAPEQFVNTEYGSVQVSHPLGHTASIYFNYMIQNQSGNVPILCDGAVCTGDALRHVFGAGFSWTPRPLLIGR